MRGVSVVVVVIVACSQAAHAQSAGAQAEVMFRQGRALLAEGKTVEACSAFEESQKLEPALSTLLNLAGCREKLGQLATAWGLFLDAARQTRTARDAATKQLHDVAQARARKLEPRVSKLTISVPMQSEVDTLEISRGDERVAPGLWNRALPIDGGTYTIKARAPGTSVWSTRVTIGVEHDIATVQIPELDILPRDLEKPVAPAPVPVMARRAEPEPVEASVPSRRSHLAAYLVAGGAVVLLGVGGGFGLSAESSYDTARSELTSQARRDSLYDSSNTKRHVAIGLAAAGVTAGGVAVWLYLRGGDREQRAGKTAQLHVAPTGAGLVVFGDF